MLNGEATTTFPSCSVEVLSVVKMGLWGSMSCCSSTLDLLLLLLALPAQDIMKATADKSILG